MSKMTQEELREVLEKRLQVAGLEEDAIQAKLRAFDEAWDDAQPRYPSGGEFHTGHPLVKYLALPGCYSGAETAVLEFFGLGAHGRRACSEQIW